MIYVSFIKKLLELTKNTMIKDWFLNIIITLAKV